MMVGEGRGWKTVKEVSERITISCQTKMPRNQYLYERGREGGRTVLSVEFYPGKPRWEQGEVGMKHHHH